MTSLFSRIGARLRARHQAWWKNFYLAEFLFDENGLLCLAVIAMGGSIFGYYKYTLLIPDEQIEGEPQLANWERRFDHRYSVPISPARPFNLPPGPPKVGPRPVPDDLLK